MADPTALQRQHCAEKTARGNVFCRKATAKRAASRWRRLYPEAKNVVAFRCKLCRKYHLGTHRKRTPDGRLLPREE